MKTGIGGNGNDFLGINVNASNTELLFRKLPKIGMRTKSKWVESWTPKAESHSAVAAFTLIYYKCSISMKLQINMIKAAFWYLYYTVFQKKHVTTFLMIS